MKRGLPGALGLGIVAMLVGCAAIANLQDPLPTEETEQTLPGRDGGDAGSAILPAPSGTTTATPDAAAQAVYDAGPPGPIDAGKTPVQCVNPGGAANADPCARPSECCSGKCIETRICVNSCVAAGAPCNPLESAECCVGSYCTSQGVFTCVPCRTAGQAAERDPGFNIPLARSCCSRSAKFDGTCN